MSSRKSFKKELAPSTNPKYTCKEQPLSGTSMVLFKPDFLYRMIINFCLLGHKQNTWQFFDDLSQPFQTKQLGLLKTIVEIGTIWLL